MKQSWTHLPKPIAAGSALVVAFAFGGLVAAHTPPTLPKTPNSEHASVTATSAAADANAHAADFLATKTTDTADTTDTTDDSHPDNHGAVVSKVAQDATLVGGPHGNHGWYVSCVAHGGTPDVTVTPNTCTMPTPATTSNTTKTHGKSGMHGQPPYFPTPASVVTP